MSNNKALNICVSTRINKKDLDNLNKFMEITLLSQSKLVYLGVRSIILLLEDTLNQCNNDKEFFKKVIKKPSWFTSGVTSFSGVFNSLTTLEKMEYLLCMENKNTERGYEDE